jgi:hypothetical protein
MYSAAVMPVAGIVVMPVESHSSCPWKALVMPVETGISYWQEIPADAGMTEGLGE